MAMNYLFLGLRDLYLPSTAAYMHLKALKSPPSHQELLALPYYRCAQKEDEGRLYRIGEDAHHHTIYISCVGNHPDVFIKGIHSLLSVCQLPLDEVRVVPCLLENLQIATFYRILSKLGLTTTAGKLGLKVALNRIPDLKTDTLALS